MNFSSLFKKNKDKSFRSRKNGEGSSSAGSGSGDSRSASAGSSAVGSRAGGSSAAGATTGSSDMRAMTAGSSDAGIINVTGGSATIVLWDLNTCGIPADCSFDEVRRNIPRAISSQIARSYIFCADPTVRESMVAHPNEVISEFIPDALEIVTTAETSSFPVLVITGDPTLCPLVSLLRQRNLHVGVACQECHNIMLKWVACYALDWDGIAHEIIPSILVEPRPCRIAPPPPGDCKMNPIYIYWDLDSCKIEKRLNENEVSMSRLTERFQNILRSLNYWGHLHFFVYAKFSNMKTMHHQAIYANNMLLKMVAEGSKADASKMILDDLLETLYQCNRPSCFMIINNGDVRSGEKSVINRLHDLILVRPSASRWPNYVDYANFIKLEWPNILEE